MYKSSTASIIIDCEDKTLLPELEEWPLSSPEEDFTPHICHLCCCPESMKISARGRLQFLQPGPLKRDCLLGVPPQQALMTLSCWEARGEGGDP
uniref:Uncharacterized protein n=1 Tax=Knipowitschia caucasica TaxID=637954 RepID=A0AAV2KS86_KNICA